MTRYLIGFTNKYFTLWSERTFKVFGGMCVAFDYKQNLSMSEEEAIKKFKERFGCEPEIDDGLRGKYQSFEYMVYTDMGGETALPFGKYEGKILKDIIVDDPEYLLWLKVNCSNKSFTAILESYDELIEVENNIEKIRKKAQRAADKLAKNMCDHYGVDGERVVAKVKIHESFGYAGMYGYTHVVKVSTSNGAYLTYSGASNIFSDIKKGKTVEVMFTVKHGYFRDAKQTQMKRPTLKVKNGLPTL